MPKMNGTGPTGQGPMTGRGMGSCEGGMRMGWCGRGQGWGTGFGRFFRSPKNQLQALEEEEKMLVEELEAIKAEKEILKDQK
jgi:hypothetical protein